MKSFTFAALAASLLLGVSVFVTGCGQSSNAGNTNQSATVKDKMGMADSKMSGMEPDHMASGGKMSDNKMDKMSDGKMANEKMSDGKMADGKIGKDKMAGK